MDLFFPQWHGGAESVRTLDGARRLLGCFSNVAFTEVLTSGAQELPVVDGIKAKPSILENLRAVRGVLERHSPDRVRVLGGDCGVSFAPITYLNRVHRGELALVWLDAHADLNTPASSPSKHFHGMVLRAALGETDAELAALGFDPIVPDQVFLCGVRELDAPELEFIERQGITRFASGSVHASPEALVAAIRGRGFLRVYVHLDFDAFDPGDLDLTRFASPDGLRLEAVIRLLGVLRAEFDLVGFALTECAPRDGAHWLASAARLERLLQALPFGS